MNNTMIILFSLLILSAFTESKRSRHKHLHRSQDSEEQNEYDDRSSNRMGPRPAFNSQIDTSLDNNNLGDEVITRNLPYPRPLQPDLGQSREGNGFGGYGSGGSDRTNNLRPFKPNREEANARNSVPYNDLETKNQRSYDIRNYGNGHHNVINLNIHKKYIYNN